jgi:GT2 family glycosyltransferase
MTDLSSRPITVSIVSHGQQALVRPLLEQLDQYSAASIDKVLLTVNAPEPDFVDATAYSFPVQRILNAQPCGFGANHNAAFVHCATDWFLVLNPDIRLDRDILTSLVMQAAPRAGLLAARIVEPGRAEPEPYRGLLTPWEILRRQSPAHAPPPEPAWVPGMFMLFRRAAYEEVQGFDPRYFLYAEDFDMCARIRLAGWQLQVRDDLAALHQAQRSSHRNLRYLRWHATSLAKLWVSSAFWRYRALVRRHAPRAD